MTTPQRTHAEHAPAQRWPRLRAFVDSAPFNRFILFVIVANAVVIGLETYQTAPAFTIINHICLAIYIAEIILKFIARDSLRAFFSDGWNLFDLAIIIAAFLPDVGALGTVARILRVFRVLRLVRTIPELRLIVSVLVRSVVSMKYIGLLAVIFFYVFAVIGVKILGPHQPEFRDLHTALFTLFRVLTQDAWAELVYEGNQHVGWYATAYHVGWIILATFILVNLVVGAIINNYQEVQHIEQRKLKPLDPSDRRLEELIAEAQEILRARHGRGS
jgi:voltage-gated sodium channel